MGHSKAAISVLEQCYHHYFYGKKSPDHGDYGAGWFVSGGVITFQRVRSAWHSPAGGAGRPAESSQPSGVGACKIEAARRLPGKLCQHSPGGRGDPSGRVLPPGGTELRELLI